jgi:predicted ATPase/DNA-binding CsgD family transcriptional regulator
LKNYLKSKQLLLILDNFEQILEAAPLVETMLVAAPHLKVLVTSRAVLHLYGEHELIVPPLAVPDPARLPPIEHLSQYDAVRLFIERARAVKSDFTITNANAQAVAEICVRLDGLPLAIELAAVRSKLFAPEQLLERLKNRLQVLTGGARTLPARQQTLRNAIDWSYSLLDANEQRLFTRLGVFVGGCTAQAADAVCNADPALGMDVLDALVSLIDKSLLKQEQERDSEPRFVMLETIREYALERLALSGQADVLRTAHTIYYLALAEHADPALKSPEQAIWLQRLEAEHENLRAALQWLLDRGAQEQALRLTGALWRFWRLRGYLSEGRRWLDAALGGEQTAVLRDSEPALAAARARALTGAGILAHYQGDFTGATALCGESLTLFRRLGDRPGVAAALHGLALNARSGGNYAAARAMYQESLAISRELGDVWGSASALCYLGSVYLFSANYAEARPVFEESLALFKQAGDPEGHAVALMSLGIVSWNEGDNHSAWSLATEALTAFQDLGNRRYFSSALSELARIATSRGDGASAQKLYEESLAVAIDLGDRFSVAQTLERLADVAVRLQQPVWAARLLGSAHTLREALGVPRPPMDVPDYERSAGAARAQLSAQAFASAWAAGQMMTPQQAVASQESPLPHKHHTPATASPADLDALTARELEVLRLVAQGFTDAQVAERLIISPRTVHGHLRSIYSKLNVTSRTAAVRYAVDHQLL